MLPTTTNKFLAPALLLVSAAMCCSALAAPNDPYFQSKGSWGQDYDDQWGLKHIGYEQLDDPGRLTEGRKQIVVAVIDSGLDYFHRDLGEGAVWINPDEKRNGIDDDDNGYVDDLIGWNFVDQDNNPWDWLGHGTHVSGLIVAATDNGEGIAGINPHVAIMPLRVMNLGGRGYSTRIAKAIYYAVGEGADIINLSLAVEAYSPLELKAINYAWEQGVTVVVASGNEAKDVANFTPASFENVITVGASDTNDEHSNFSNWGSAVDISAPGNEILSLRAARTDFIRIMAKSNYERGASYVGEHADYYRASGTSFAAPFVTGVASLLLTKYPDATPDDIKRMLLQSANDIGVPGVDQYTGYGLLDAGAALSIDREFFIDTFISGVTVVMKNGQPVIQVHGTGNADRFKRATIELGRGDEPVKWTRAAKDLSQPVVDGIVAELDTGEVSKAKVWTLRLVVEHESGKTREARFLLELG